MNFGKVENPRYNSMKRLNFHLSKLRMYQRVGQQLSKGFGNVRCKTYVQTTYKAMIVGDLITNYVPVNHTASFLTSQEYTSDAKLPLKAQQSSHHSRITRS